MSLGRLCRTGSLAPVCEGHACVLLLSLSGRFLAVVDCRPCCTRRPRHGLRRVGRHLLSEAIPPSECDDSRAGSNPTRVGTCHRRQSAMQCCHTYLSGPHAVLSCSREEFSQFHCGHMTQLCVGTYVRSILRGRRLFSTAARFEQTWRKRSCQVCAMVTVRCHACR